MGVICRRARTGTKKMVFKWSKNGRRRSEDHLNTKPKAAHHFDAKTGIKIVFKWSSPRRRPFFINLNIIF